MKKCLFFECKQVCKTGKNKGCCKYNSREYRMCTTTECREYVCHMCVRSGTCINEPAYSKDLYGI